MTVNKHKKNCQTEINVSTHHQNLPTMWTEMFKIYMGTTPEILIELISFKLPSNYNLRCQPDFIDWLDFFIDVYLDTFTFCKHF